MFLSSEELSPVLARQATSIPFPYLFRTNPPAALLTRISQCLSTASAAGKSPAQQKLCLVPNITTNDRVVKLKTAAALCALLCCMLCMHAQLKGCNVIMSCIDHVAGHRSIFIDGSAQRYPVTHHRAWIPKVKVPADLSSQHIVQCSALYCIVLHVDALLPLCI